MLGQVTPSQPDGYFWIRSSELSSCTMVAEHSNWGLYRSESNYPQNCSYNTLVILQKYLPTGKLKAGASSNPPLSSPTPPILQQITDRWAAQTKPWLGVWAVTFLNWLGDAQQWCWQAFLQREGHSSYKRKCVFTWHKDFWTQGEKQGTFSGKLFPLSSYGMYGSL